MFNTLDSSNERSVEINDKQLTNRNYTIMTITTGSAVPCSEVRNTAYFRKKIKEELMPREIESILVHFKEGKKKLAF